jgi:hypothetical protein
MTEITTIKMTVREMILRFIYVARRIITSLESYAEIAKSARDKFKNFTPIN